MKNKKIKPRLLSVVLAAVMAVSFNMTAYAAPGQRANIQPYSSQGQRTQNNNKVNQSRNNQIQYSQNRVNQQPNNNRQAGKQQNNWQNKSIPSGLFQGNAWGQTWNNNGKNIRGNAWGNRFPEFTADDEAIVTEEFKDNGRFHGNRPVPRGDTENPEINEQEYIQEEEKGEMSATPDYSFIKTFGDVTEEEYSDFIAYINLVANTNPAVVESMLVNGWTIILTSGDLDYLLFNGTTQYVTGATIPEYKEIYIETGEYEYCVVHEIGHYVDIALGNVSSSEEFNEVYLSESANLTAYGQTNAVEFFAEAYMYSILEPETMQNKCPSTSLFIEACKQAL